MIVYFDTSALLKLFLPDERGAADVVDVWMNASAAVTVGLTWVEARAALAAARRARRLSPAAHEIATHDLDEMWDQLDVVAVGDQLIRKAGELAETNGLRGYDAVHLAAALTVGATVLACADRDLSTAGRQHGMDILGFSQR